MLLENLFGKKFHDFIAEAAKAFMPYSEVLQDGFVKWPCDADLVFWSWVLDFRMKTFEKTEGDLLRKCLQINKQLQKEIRSGNLIIFDFKNIGICWWIFLLQLCRWLSVAIMKLKVSTAHMQVRVSAAKMWATVFIIIMQMGVSVAIMQVVLSAVNYALDYFYCNYAHDSLSYSTLILDQISFW